jgi:hypothetical protein
VYINTGRLLQNEISGTLRNASGISDTGERIAYLSGLFLDTEYQESTLSGSVDTDEELVIDLEGVDCFTFIDYIEAMRLSGSFPEFIENLKRVRYREGEVSFEKRNHFFTDWGEHNSGFLTDVTEAVGTGNARRTMKRLNLKNDGGCLIEGIDVVEREIRYIPSEEIDDTVISNLLTGDYIGIYSGKAGLDVSHVGIIIRNGDDVFIRHASTVHRRVVDEDFSSYIKDRPGIIVLRPK